MRLAEELRRILDADSVTEAQRTTPGLSMGDDEDTKPGAFKISSKAMGIMKAALGADWEGPESALFKKYRDVVTGLSNDDLVALFGAESMDKAQDFVAGKPRPAFNKWLAMSSKVSPQLGKLVRARPDWASVLFYLTVVRVSGRDMADTILKRYFATESDHVGAVKARVKAREKVEELEAALAEAREEEKRLLII